jgi:hypothetical protein
MFSLREAGTMSDILITPLIKLLIPINVSQSPTISTSSETALHSLNFSMLEAYVA